jgi:hypothetical protein
LRTTLAWISCIHQSWLQAKLQGKFYITIKIWAQKTPKNAQYISRKFKFERIALHKTFFLSNRGLKKVIFLKISFCTSRIDYNFDFFSVCGDRTRPRMRQNSSRHFTRWRNHLHVWRRLFRRLKLSLRMWDLRKVSAVQSGSEQRISKDKFLLSVDSLFPFFRWHLNWEQICLVFKSCWDP